MSFTKEINFIDLDLDQKLNFAKKYLKQKNKTMEYQELFNKFWQNYSSQNPSANKVYQLFTQEGEQIQNDHIAFRTFNDLRLNIEVLAKIFESIGYKAVGKYNFEEKKLRAIHYENYKINDAPKVFISELILDKCSSYLQTTIKEAIDNIPESEFVTGNLLLKGNIWGKPSYSVYENLRNESEYAAWLYVYGFRTNHFTVSINSFKKYDTIEKVNQFVKDNGFILNASGGEIKGTPEMLLQQSSIMADIISVDFIEGNFEIPACYYEFALRFKDKNGFLYNGFHAKSADKIFESTNFYKKKQ